MTERLERRTGPAAYRPLTVQKGARLPESVIREAEVAILPGELLPPEHKRAWLQTPRPRFGDRSPKQAIEKGEAELVALIVESALEGHPD